METAQINKPAGWRVVLPKPLPGCVTVKMNPAPVQEVPAGRMFGDYELLEEISRGSMGVVWKARQRSLNRIVALKAVSAGVLATTEDVTRFRSEAETVARIKHPNVISIHEIGEHQGIHFFSMDYIEGRSLEAMLHERLHPPREAAALIRTIAEAVHFMHMHDVMHRDIKPLNIMVDHWGRPVLLDFGLAKLFSDESRLTQSGVVMGSPCYMAPEQVERGEECVGPHTEVHALGVTLYQLVTGTLAYSGSTAEETLMNVVRWAPKPPSEHVPSIPRDLETIVLKCLEKSPSRRYPTAKHLAEDLGRFLSGVPVLAQRAKMGRRALTWLEQHPWTLAWSGLGLSSLLFGTTFGLWEQTRYLTSQIDASGDATPPFSPWLQLTGFEFFTMMGSMILSAMIIRSSAYGLRLMEAVLKPELMTAQARRAVPATVLKLSVVIASLGGLEGLRSFMGFIEHGVWQKSWRWEQLMFETYALAMWSVGLLGMTWRFYRAQHLGTSMPHEISALPPACQAAVHAAIFRGDTSHAVRLCREATNMDRPAATRCVNGLLRHLREMHGDKFGDDHRQPVAISVYLCTMIAVCAIVPAAAMVLTPAAWQHATLAALLGIFLGMILMEMENWLRKPLHQAALFVSGVVLLARAVIMKAELGLSDGNYLWLTAGILGGAAIVAAVARGKATPPEPAAGQRAPDVTRS